MMISLIRVALWQRNDLHDQAAFVWPRLNAHRSLVRRFFFFLLQL